jgi:hypothetical protein
LIALRIALSKLRNAIDVVDRELGKLFEETSK